MASPSALANYSVWYSVSQIIEIDHFLTTRKTAESKMIYGISGEEAFTFWVYLWPSGFKMDGKLLDPDGVYISLRYQCCPPELWIKFDASLINVKGEKQFTMSCGMASDQLVKEDILSRFSSRENIYLAPSTLLHAGTLKVLFEVCILKKETSAFVTQLSNDYASLLANGTFSDVTLVVGKRDFPVHKAILSARSPVFARMFTSEFKESKENCVVIEEMDEQVFAELLNFIYTEKVENLPENASALLIAAEKYQIESLKDFCGHYLSSTLTMDSWLSHLQLAYLHNATQLQGKCLEFVKQHLREVKLTQDWKQLITVKSAVNQELLGLLFQTVMEIV